MTSARMSMVIFCGSLVLLLAVSLSVVGCTDLSTATTDTDVAEVTTTLTEVITTLAPTTTEAPATTTTLTPVAVTRESSKSPCLITHAFTQDGTNYVVVDYIQINWTQDELGYWDAGQKNTNKKLRTFIVPSEAELWWPKSEDYYENQAAPPLNFTGLLKIPSLMPDLDEGFTAGAYNWLGSLFWEIRVRDGEVVSLVVAQGPED